MPPSAGILRTAGAVLTFDHFGALITPRHALRWHALQILWQIFCVSLLTMDRQQQTSVLVYRLSIAICRGHHRKGLSADNPSCWWKLHAHAETKAILCTSRAKWIISTALTGGTGFMFGIVS